MPTDSFNLDTGTPHDAAVDRAVREAVPEMTDEEREAVQYTEKLYDEYATNQQAWNEAALENIELRHNTPFTAAQVQAIKDRGLAPVAVPLWHSIEKQAQAHLCANKPRFQGLGREESDTKVAALYSDLMTHVHETSGGDNVIRELVKDDLTPGRGVLFVGVDPEGPRGQPELFLRSLYPLEVYPDPNSREKDWSDAAHILVAREISREQVEARYPDKKHIIAQARAGINLRRFRTQASRRYGAENQVIGVGRYGREYPDDLYILIERYSKVRVRHIHLTEPSPDGTQTEKLLPADSLHDVWGPDSYVDYLRQRAYEVVIPREGAVEYAISPEEVQFYDRLYAEYSVADGRPALVPLRRGPVEQTPQGQPAEPPIALARLTPVTKGDLIGRGVIGAEERMVRRVQVTCCVGGQLLYQYVLPTSSYPVIPYQTEHDRNPYPTSVATKCRPIIEEYNKKQQGIIANLTSGMGNTWWVQKGTLEVNGGAEAVQNEMLNPSPKVLEYYGDSPPIQAQYVPLARQFFENQDRLKAQLYETTGFYPVMQGDPGNRPDRETKYGTLHFDEAANRRVRQSLDDLYHVLNKAGQVVADLIPFVYAGRRVARLLDPNGQPENRNLYDAYGDLIYRLRDHSVPRADIQVESGSTLPHSRVARLQSTMEMFGLLSKIGPEAAFPIVPDIFRLSELPNWEEKAQQFFQNVDLAARMQQLQEENDILKGDLQTREREVYHAKMQERLAKSEHSAVRAEERVKKAAELYSQRAQDKLSDVDRLVEVIDQLFPEEGETPTSERTQAQAT